MTVTLRTPAAGTTPALLLRPWTERDAEALIEAAGDAELRRWTSLAVDDAEGAAHWLGNQRAGWESGRRLSFAVLAQEALAAHVVVKWAEGERGRASVGYWTAAPARGRGVAPAALTALTDWVFETFADEGLERLELRHQMGNQGSCRVAEKAGYHFDRMLDPWPPHYSQPGHVHRRLRPAA
ncbi:GNAT family N-acetyltransferase [Streptomyces orinoci]|uniref:GNAT family N-acetyltransferase n=1 Tax=Streptomyces orinoci TaxID=67339 RepID=A0ABV3JTU3_STRON|nr:GNAT family N-acetyltransferase [Streptomyces orinoci]